MKILGVDPGFAFMGLGVLDMTPVSSRVLHHETFKTTNKLDAEERVDAICERLFTMIDRWQPEAIGYENQAGVEVAMQRNDEGTNYSSRRVHEVVGAIRCAARLFELPCYCHAPSTIKVAVLGKGGGRAKKARIKEAVRVIFGVAGCSEHAADALAVSVCTAREHARHLALMRASARLIR